MECQHGLEYFQVVRGLLFDELPWEGFPFSKFIVVSGAVVDVCMVILLALGWIKVWPLLAPYTSL